MESTVIFAAISAVLAGFYSFSFKVIAERNYDTNLSYVYMYFTAFTFSLIVTVFEGGVLTDAKEFVLIVFFSACMVIFYNMSMHTRVESMRNMDAMLFYPLYKTFGPITVIVISYFFFNETLTMREWLGIICGISIPLLLITKTENRIQKNLYRGCIFMLFTSLFTALAGSIQKYSVDLGFDLNIFLTVYMFFGGAFCGVGYYRSKNTKKHYTNAGIFPFSVIIGLFFVGSAYTFIRALEGNFAIATTINSFSILIPIILSIIFYGEHFNLKKGIVIALSIVSILLFI
ncbi:SMR family transporter [Candidatus Gracilibacteria bacterium]|nr:SMR family transporter [Candidatus Gracilibacteria bacterium]